MNPADLARQIGVVDSNLKRAVSSNLLSNPVANTVVCDTGALTGGHWDITIKIGSTVTPTVTTLSIEWRNAANDSNIAYFYYLGASPDSKEFTWRNVKLASQERIRIRVDHDMTGLVSGNILAVMRAE